MTDTKRLSPGELMERCERVAARYPKGAIYRHRASGFLYRISTTALLEVNAMPAVIYTPVQPDEARDAVLWVRPMDEFERHFEEERP